MELRNRAHDPGGFRIRSQRGQSRQLAARNRGRNVESQGRHGAAHSARLAREALMEREQATPASPDLMQACQFAESPARQPITAARRGLVQDDRQLLAHCNLFRWLAADERDVLIAHARIRICAADESIFLMGSTGDSIMAVLSGHVRISVASPEGKEIMLGILVAGEVFGEIALLGGKERAASVRAAGECRVAILDRRDVLTFFERHPNAWRGLVETLCERLRQADHRMAEFAFMNLPVRLANALLRMAAMEPHTLNGDPSPRVHLTQREIGYLIGATRESVNKWLGSWQREGIVRIAESLITIVDRHALEELAQLESEPRFQSSAPH